MCDRKEDVTEAAQAEGPAQDFIYGLSNAILAEKERYHPSHLDRIEKSLAYAKQEARKVQRMERLAELLRKNPEVAEILDLLEEVR